MYTGVGTVVSWVVPIPDLGGCGGGQCGSSLESSKVEVKNKGSSRKGLTKAWHNKLSKEMKEAPRKERTVKLSRDNISRTSWRRGIGT